MAAPANQAGAAHFASRRGRKALAVAAVLSGVLWVLWSQLFADGFRTVELSEPEAASLERKLRVLGVETGAANGRLGGVRLFPERGGSSSDDRAVYLSERELNALVSRDPRLASRLAIAMSNTAASARLLLPLDARLPLVGGRKIRIEAQLIPSRGPSGAVIVLGRIGVMGVPLPRAWVRRLESTELVGLLRAEIEHWSRSVPGIGGIELVDGRLEIELEPGSS